MSIEPEQRRDQDTGSKLLALLHGLSKALVLYEINNDTVTRLIEDLWFTIETYFKAGGDDLRLQLLEDEAFINGQLIRMDARLYERTTELSRTLQGFEIGEVHLESGVTKHQVTGFLRDLSTSLRTQRGVLRTEGYGGLHLNKRSGRSMAALRFEPDKLAIWSYASLLDVVDQLFAKHAANQAPTLLPIKRILQLIIDGTAAHGGIYQMLSAIRDPTQPLSPTRMRVGMAVDAIGFGVFVGLPHRDLMSLSLAVLLGGLSDSKDPDAAVAPLFRYTGLGDAAMALVLTVYDLRSARKGGNAGVPGRMLSVVETYHEQITGSTPSTPPEVLEAMVAGKIPGADAAAARVFAAYKGRYPLGTSVRLSTGGIGVVIAHPTEGPRERPLVAMVGPGGSLSQRVDLLTNRGVQVAAVVSSEEAGVDLTRG
jgi:hypothetical protein